MNGAPPKRAINSCCQSDLQDFTSAVLSGCLRSTFLAAHGTGPDDSVGAPASVRTHGTSSLPYAKAPAHGRTRQEIACTCKYPTKLRRGLIAAALAIREFLMISELART
jgi:hypothetical protein